MVKKCTLDLKQKSSTHAPHGFVDNATISSKFKLYRNYSASALPLCCQECKGRSPSMVSQRERLCQGWIWNCVWAATFPENTAHWQLRILNRKLNWDSPDILAETLLLFSPLESLFRSCELKLDWNQSIIRENVQIMKLIHNVVQTETNR